MTLYEFGQTSICVNEYKKEKNDVGKYRGTIFLSEVERI